jgi:hypothetical protein
MKRLLLTILTLALLAVAGNAAAATPSAAAIPGRALERHVRFFADAKGNITPKSLDKGARALGMPHTTRFTVLNAVGPVTAGNVKVLHDDGISKENVGNLLHFRLPITRIEKAIDKSTTGTFTGQGTSSTQRVDSLLAKAHAASGAAESARYETVVDPATGQARREAVLRFTDLKALVKHENPGLVSVARFTATTRWGELFDIANRAWGQKGYVTRSQLLALYSVDKNEPTFFDQAAKALASRPASASPQRR